MSIKNFVIITNDSNGDKEATVVAISGVNDVDDRVVKDICYKALKDYNESDGSLTREDMITEAIAATPGLEVSWPLVTYTVIDITD